MSRPDIDQDLLVFSGGPIHTGDAEHRTVEALAVAHGRIVAAGSHQELRQQFGRRGRWIDLAGRCAVPGLIDGHAHMDREGLKSVWPSVAGVRSIDDVLQRIEALAKNKAPGEWIVTMPLGDPPDYDGMPGLLREQRWPDRRDLDRVSPDNPVYIRPIWGYWRNKPPLVSIANSRALAAAGITRRTPAPAPEVTIETDDTGEPNGIFVERTQMPIVELTLLAQAPHFTPAQRVEALARSMHAYNAVGTTAVFEGHGVAPEVIGAYQTLAASGRQSVRASLIFSPPWSTCPSEDVAEMIRQWCRWLSGRGLGDHWLRVFGLFAEEGADPRSEPRAASLPQTGWAGFCYDAALPRAALRELLLEAARNGIRVATIWADLIDLFAEVHQACPIDNQRWVWGHISVVPPEAVARARDLGLVVTTHTNRHIQKSGGGHLDRLPPEQHDWIVPLRSMVDAGIPVSLGSDNLPPSLLNPINHVVARRSGTCGRIVAEGQKLSRQEALRCASWGGAYASGAEAEIGSLEVGKRADVVVLSEDLMSVAEDRIPDLRADITVVDGRVVYDRESGASAKAGDRDA